jgi:hypothetical protein
VQRRRNGSPARKVDARWVGKQLRAWWCSRTYKEERGCNEAGCPRRKQNSGGGDNSSAWTGDRDGADKRHEEGSPFIGTASWGGTGWLERVATHAGSA